MHEMNQDVFECWQSAGRYPDKQVQGDSIMAWGASKSTIP